jgi:UDP-N-acetylglucosamine 2-epimerase
MAVENLLREKVKGEIVFSGNTVSDLLKTAVQRIGGKIRQDQFVLMTSHRYENIFVRSRLKRVIDILGHSRLPIYWPLHRMTETQLKRFGLLDRVRKMNVKILPPLAYDEFISFLLRCNYVITDGGSIEEETIILGKACLLLRKKTERGEGLKMGLTFLTGLDPARSEKIIRMIEGGYKTSQIPTL